MLAIRPLRILTAFLTAVLPVATAACRHSGEPPADLVFRNGAVYTLDAARSWAGAVAVRGGRIVYVGTDSLPPGTIGPKTEVVELKGGMLLPGLPGRARPPRSTAAWTSATATSPPRRAPPRSPAADPLVCGGPPHAAVDPGLGLAAAVFPRRQPPQGAARQPGARPAGIALGGGRPLGVGQLAGARAGRHHPGDARPANGRIERDPRTGEPSGTLRESAADLFDRVLPAHTAAEFAAGLERAQRLASRFGLTTIFDADAEEPELRGYADADRAGRLHLRVVAALSCARAAGTPCSRGCATGAPGTRRPHVRPTAVKLLPGRRDRGAHRRHARALSRPARATRASRCATRPSWTRSAGALDRDGFQIHVHAIGDRAIRMTLDALARAPSANGAARPPPRHRPPAS